jgi:hypothetical protein
MFVRWVFGVNERCDRQHNIDEVSHLSVPLTQLHQNT